MKILSTNERPQYTYYINDRTFQIPMTHPFVAFQSTHDETAPNEATIQAFTTPPKWLSPANIWADTGFSPSIFIALVDMEMHVNSEDHKDSLACNHPHYRPILDLIRTNDELLHTPAHALVDLEVVTAIDGPINWNIAHTLVNYAQSETLREIIEGASTTFMRGKFLRDRSYVPYCGCESCRNMPRTVQNVETLQFECPECRWTSQLEDTFINAYKRVHNIS